MFAQNLDIDIDSCNRFVINNRRYTYDYVLTKNDLPVGYIEAKDLGLDLNDKKYTEQFDCYKTTLNNLVFTNYLIFDSCFDLKITL